MNQTLILANSVHRPHSQISMRNLSLSLFHKFVEMRARACGRQRPSDVVFWLNLAAPYQPHSIPPNWGAVRCHRGSKIQSRHHLAPQGELRSLNWNMKH